MTGAVRLDDVRWETFEIPYGSQPVQMCVLREESSRARTIFVRFPSGWSRRVRGSYAADEEIVLLEGSLRIDYRTHQAPGWVFVAAGTARRDTAAPHGALALARFAGPARWTSDFDPAAPPVTSAALRPSGDGVASPFGSGRAWPLRTAPVSSWLVEPPPPDTPAGVDAELFSVPDRTWTFVGAGTQMPAMPGPWFCRTYPSAVRGEAP